MQDSTHDVVVIGGGLGGLLAARRLLARGREVVVLEQGAELGGLGRSPALGEVPVNLGPRALYRGGRALALLRELGIEPRGFWPAATGGGFFDLDGELVPMPTSAVALLTRSWLSWRERVELAWAMREVAKADAAGTLAEWLARRRSPLVRQVLAALCRVTSYTNAPQGLPAARALEQLRLGLEGVLYADGGWRAVVDELARGVAVRTGVCVTRVSRAGGAAEVRCPGGEVLRANAAVLAVPVAAAAKLTNDEALLARAARCAPVQAACVDLVLRELPEPGRRLVLGLGAPTYFSVHSRPGASPVTVHLAWYLAPSDATAGPELAQRLDAFADRVQPGWRDVVVARRYFPHMRVMEDLPGHGATALAPPLYFVSGLAADGFLLDAVARSTDAVVAALGRARAEAQ